MICSPSPYVLPFAGCVKYTLPPSGWQFKQGVDASGTDIGSSTTSGDWARAIAACDTKPNCIAVTTSGVMKSQISSYKSTGMDEPCTGLLERSKCGVCMLLELDTNNHLGVQLGLVEFEVWWFCTPGVVPNLQYSVNAIPSQVGNLGHALCEVFLPL